MILGALWVGHSKPNISAYLSKFIEEIKHLSSTGFQWINCAKKQVTSTVDLLLVSVDSVARPVLQNILQFNGRNARFKTQCTDLSIHTKTEFTH